MLMVWFAVRVLEQVWTQCVLGGGRRGGSGGMGWSELGGPGGSGGLDGGCIIL